MAPRKRILWLACVSAILCSSRPPITCWAADDPISAVARTIVVRVTNAAGEAQPGVDVSLFDYDDDWRYWQNVDRDARTDENGVAEYAGLPADKSYLVRAAYGELVGYRQCVLTGEEPRHEAAVSLERPVVTSLLIEDGAGNPIEGARIWSIPHTGSNGSMKFDWQTLESLGLDARRSDARGEIVLPALPPGTADVRLIHPDYAPCTIKGVVVGDSSIARAVMPEGVKLTLHLDVDAKQPAIDSIVIDLRRKVFDHPSTWIGRLPEPVVDGRVELMVEAGEYDWLRLRHPDYAVAPIYKARHGSTIADPSEPFEVRAGHGLFAFQLKRKVNARGRVIDEATGKSMTEAFIEGKLPAGAVEGPFAHFADEWSNVEWADVDDNGEYEIELAAGRARVYFHKRGLVATPDYHEIDVAADGSTVVPDFLVRPMPKVRGVVHDQNGRPIQNVVVRFRGSILTYTAEPVLTDKEGRFELVPPWIPEDLQTGERLPVQTIVAFHPTKPLYSQRAVRLDDAASLDDVVLQLERRDFNSLITRFPADLSPWQRGVMPADREAELAAISLRGKPAPELDGARWLNTPQAAMALADYRDKFVLLQFWTTWCGPCHTDMPSLKILHSLYQDQVVIIGVHDNSMPLAAIEADVAKEGLEYPIVVDHPDGRILARYKAHGVSGYPSYILVGPDGNVIQDDDTVAGPTLRSFKIEIVRELLLNRNRTPIID